MGEPEKRKKGRPSKADLARRAAADLRRSSRRRNVMYNLDYDTDDDDEMEEREYITRREKKKVKVEEEDTSAEPRERERKGRPNDADSVTGTPPEHPMGFQLPAKETLLLILDKLQKKDKYRVFAEPVDPDELPDYYDVIEHPMDFATVRKKLGKGRYSTLEQFENDVLLICSNAMQYNAPDTIFHKQALHIQELAKREVQRLRVGDEQHEKEIQSEQKPTANSLDITRHIKMPIARVAPKTIVSDLSSGVSPSTLGDLQPRSATKPSGIEGLGNVDEFADGNATQSDNNLDMTEDFDSGKVDISRLGRKPLVHGENRRATYDISIPPVSHPESPYSTFDEEIKQLVPVGLHADDSYARSLARFAASLGPVAWNIASKRIEKALDPGTQFGRGWVGDFEPISAPVLATQKCYQKASVSSRQLNAASNYNKEKVLKTVESIHKSPIVNGTASPTNCSFPSKSQPLREAMLEVKLNIAEFGSYQVESPRTKNTQPEKIMKKQIELNSTPSPTDQSPRGNFWAQNFPNGTNGSDSKSMEPLTPDISRPVWLPLMQPQNSGLGEATNGKLRNNNFDINKTITPFNNDCSNTSTPEKYIGEQPLTDPVQLMRRLAENAPKLEQEDLSYASSTAAQGWMSIGAGSPKSVSENIGWMSIGAGSPKSVSENIIANSRNQFFMNNLHSPIQVSRFRNDCPDSGMQCHPMINKFPIQGFVSPQFHMGNRFQFQNRPQMALPQLVANDISRFQMHSSPCQGQLLQRHSQKQETRIPPDLNLAFQTSLSPGRQSSGLQVDSQQPDLALQL